MNIEADSLGCLSDGDSYPEFCLVKKLVSRGVGTEISDHLVGFGKITKLSLGDTFKAGTDGLGMIWVKDGTLLRYNSFFDGQESATAIMTPGAFIMGCGSASYKNDQVFFRCLENATLISIPASVIYNCASRDLAVFRFILEEQYVNDRVFEEGILLRNILSKRQHILMTIAALFSPRINPSRGSILLTLEDLASFSSVTRQYYCKVLKSLVNEGVVTSEYGRLKMENFSSLLNQMDKETLLHFRKFEELVLRTI